MYLPTSWSQFLTMVAPRRFELFCVWRRCQLHFLLVPVSRAVTKLHDWAHLVGDESRAETATFTEMPPNAPGLSRAEHRLRYLEGIWVCCVRIVALVPSLLCFGSITTWSKINVKSTWFINVLCFLCSSNILYNQEYEWHFSKQKNTGCWCYVGNQAYYVP